ncbi:MAG: molybdopterin-dependent oxidoreductase [Anaerolineae bacterium]|nr:molybdopterin-dependent oxidoreductase [Anaerolineae bacterium]
MRPQLVDWTLLTLSLGAALGGFATWLMRDEHVVPFVALHVALGTAVLLPLAWKLRRVSPRLARTRAWDWKTPISVLTAAAAIGALVTGVVWTRFQVPTGYPNGMHLHITFGIALIALAVMHMALRFKLPARRDWRDRRSALRWLGMAVFGAVAVPVQKALDHQLNLPGAQRRFTGSRPAGDDTTTAMPVTNWMFDYPAPVDMALWRLSVEGAVAQTLRLSYADLLAFPQSTVRATLDCTGGWHSTQTWYGVRVGDLLDRASVSPSARYISFVSITGYRWSLPVSEAREALLAVGYGDDLLTHWHGAPLRLVAPGRRGFMWVKWVTHVRALTHPDLGQWLKIFTSGLESTNRFAT